MSLEDNKVLGRRFLRDIWSEGKLEVADEILAPNFVMTLGVKPYKLEGPVLLKQLVTRNRAAFQGLNYDLDEEGIVAEGDKVVIHWTMNAKHVGLWGDSAPSNKDVSIKGMSFFRVANDQLVFCEVQNEALSLMRQIGAIPPQGATEYKVVETNKAIVHQYINIIMNKRDFSRFSEVASPDFVAHRGSHIIRGVEGIKRQMGVLCTAFPDIKFCADDIVAEGNEVTVLFTAPGTHRGEFVDIPPTEKKIELKGIGIYGLEGGKIKKVTYYWNDMELVQQLMGTANIS